MTYAKCGIASLLVSMSMVLVGCGRDSAGDDARTAFADKVSGTAEIRSVNLGAPELMDGGPASIFVNINNQSDYELSVGSDLWVPIDGSNLSKGALVIAQDAWPADSQLHDYRAMMFASGSNMLSGIQHEKLKIFLYTSGGQAVNLGDSITSKYTGTWAQSIPSKGSASFTQQLVISPGTCTGWAISPPLTPKSGKMVPFRLIIPLGTGNQKCLLMPMTAESLRNYVADQSKPMPLRKALLGMLTALPDQDAWRTAAQILEGKDSGLELRKAAAGWLGTRGPADALQVVDKVLWDGNSDEDLQVSCYCALTWSELPEAKPLWQKAKSHPSAKVRQIANGDS